MLVGVHSQGRVADSLWEDQFRVGVEGSAGWVGEASDKGFSGGGGVGQGGRSEGLFWAQVLLGVLGH